MILACQIGKNSFTPSQTIFSSVYMDQIYSLPASFFECGSLGAITVKQGSKVFIKRIRIDVLEIPGLRINPICIFNFSLQNFRISPAYFPVQVTALNEWIDVNIEFPPALIDTLLKLETDGSGYAYIAYDGRNLQSTYQALIPKITATIQLDANCVVL